MKTLFRFAFVTILFACSVSRSVAQDTIVFTDGTFVSCKILQVSTDEVKYKRFDNLDGPDFVKKSSEINMIKYKGGVMELLNKQKEAAVVVPVDPNPPIQRRGPYYVQGYDRMREREMQDVIKKVNDPGINAHIKKARFARGMQNIGFIAIPALAFTLGYSAYAVITNNNLGTGSPLTVDYTPAIATGIVGVAGFATSIAFSVSRKSHNNAALKIYNEKY